MRHDIGIHQDTSGATNIWVNTVKQEKVVSYVITQESAQRPIKLTVVQHTGAFAGERALHRTTEYLVGRLAIKVDPR